MNEILKYLVINSLKSPEAIHDSLANFGTVTEFCDLSSAIIMINDDWSVI
jgi:hypothetical protein